MTAIMIESTEVKQGTTITIGSEEMKQLKNMVKTHKNNAFEALNFVYVQIEKDGIKVMFSDSENTIVSTLDCDIYKMDDLTSFTLPISVIKKITGIKKKDVFTFEIESFTSVIMQRNSIKKKVNTLDVDAFPKKITNEKFVDIPMKNGKKGLSFNDILRFEKASLATSNSETRPILAAVCFREGMLYATDSHRLFGAESPLEMMNFDINIHKKSIKIFKNIFKKNDTIKMSVGESLVKLTNGKTTTYSKLIEGKYPRVENMFPQYYQATFEICDITKFKEVLSDMNKLVANLTVREKGIAELKAIKAEEFHIEATLDISRPQLNDDLFEVSFNPKNVLDALKQLDDKAIRLKFTGGMSPFIIEPIEKENGEFALFSPIRTY